MFDEFRIVDLGGQGQLKKVVALPIERYDDASPVNRSQSYLEAQEFGRLQEKMRLHKKVMAELLAEPERIAALRSFGEFKEFMNKVILNNHFSHLRSQDRGEYNKVTRYVEALLTQLEPSLGRDFESNTQFLKALKIALLKQLETDLPTSDYEFKLPSWLRKLSGLPPTDVDAFFLALGKKAVGFTIVGLGGSSLGMLTAGLRLYQLADKGAWVKVANWGVILGELLQGASLALNFKELERDLGNVSLDHDQVEELHNAFGVAGLWTVATAISIVELSCLRHEAKELVHGDLETRDNSMEQLLRQLKAAELRKKSHVVGFMGAMQYLGGAGIMGDIHDYTPADVFKQVGAWGIMMAIKYGIVANAGRFLPTETQIHVSEGEDMRTMEAFFLGLVKLGDPKAHTHITDEERTLIGHFLGEDFSQEALSEEKGERTDWQPNWFRRAVSYVCGLTVHPEDAEGHKYDFVFFQEMFCSSTWQSCSAQPPISLDDIEDMKRPVRVPQQEARQDVDAISHQPLPQQRGRSPQDCDLELGDLHSAPTVQQAERATPLGADEIRRQLDQAAFMKSLSVTLRREYFRINERQPTDELLLAFTRQHLPKMLYKQAIDDFLAKKER